MGKLIYLKYEFEYKLIIGFYGENSGFVGNKDNDEK
jgi:hypothetical protein